MTYKLTTYKTIRGKKEILETQKKKSTEAIIYQDDKPAFFVDCFDLQTESNIIMNSLVLCQQRSLKAVIKEIAAKNNVNLSIKETPLFVLKSSYELKEMELPPLPENWLN
ncbi:hypothetical protein [Tenacibaculum sp. IB213877]|uniref:hypothetical protein n=1 Tax=Tenacibaculum sp. IB213877 TaxID=3097351 RepID=UPI002A5A6DB3|nr:hypothetical protein [Tenacibaculum sp. IB213877]MDY0781189.1 hypothetical protein [Tenacibaculum sp. IB213877]